MLERAKATSAQCAAASRTMAFAPQQHVHGRTKPMRPLDAVSPTAWAAGAGAEQGQRPANSPRDRPIHEARQQCGEDTKCPHHRRLHTTCTTRGSQVKPAARTGEKAGAASEVITGLYRAEYGRTARNGSCGKAVLRLVTYLKPLCPFQVPASGLWALLSTSSTCPTNRLCPAPPDIAAHLLSLLPFAVRLPKNKPRSAANNSAGSRGFSGSGPSRP